MSILLKRLTDSPIVVRAAPFVVFVLLTALQGTLGDASRYWLYLAKSLVGIWMIVIVRPFVPELKFAITLRSILAGVLVFSIWVGLDGFYPTTDAIFSWFGLGSKEAVVPWNPNTQFGAGSAMAWLLIVTRIVGSSLVVPPIEEMFYRSLVYRWIANPDVESVSLKRFVWVPFIVTALLFGLAHREWLPGILCAMIYQSLVFRRGDLGEAITAHGVTNLLLGLWVVWKGAWQFW
ncbi:MAG: CAAX prenyl protease-related protein [Opitutaceae bacterium]|nr:CAAX prenyl protease-related protein [Verrucomicrobiales bacterium]